MVIEGGTVAFFAGTLAAELLPTSDDDVTVFGRHLDHARLLPGFLAGDDCGPAARERIKDRIPALAVAPDRPFDQIHRLYGWVILATGGPLNEPHVALVPRTTPAVFGPLAPAIQNRLILTLVI